MELYNVYAMLLLIHVYERKDTFQKRHILRGSFFQRELEAMDFELQPIAGSRGSKTSPIDELLREGCEDTLFGSTKGGEECEVPYEKNVRRTQQMGGGTS